ncbi:MAG: Cna B-type domain-containing protein [Eubacteriales bacterium]
MKKKKIFAFALCLAFVLTAVSPGVLAIYPIDPDAESSLSIVYRDGDVPVCGAEFDLYRVADSSEFAEFTLCGDFVNAGVEPRADDAEGWQSVAGELLNFVLENAPEPLASGKTDEAGKLQFSNLAPGLYLAVGAPCVQGGYVFTAEPMPVSLPNREPGSDEWIFDVEASVKYSRENETLERSVLKVWADGGNENSRPEKVEIELLCDGELFEKVELSAENDWQHSWTGLDSMCRWSVREVKIENYVSKVRQEGDVFIVTNTWCGPESPDEDLPQTGMLWWPVPLLAAAGILLVLAGVIVGRHEEK